jgi:hypothetical protein
MRLRHTCGLREGLATTGAHGIDRESGEVATASGPGVKDRCEGCRRPLDGAVYQLHGPDGPRSACRRCALTYRPLLRRSFLIALVVGSVLVAINQGDQLLTGSTEPALLWKVPLTYLVPFVVATWGGLLSSRAR